MSSALAAAKKRRAFGEPTSKFLIIAPILLLNYLHKT